MNNDDQNAENAARKVGMVPELGMGYAGWRTAPPYTERAPLTLSEIVAAVRTNELVTGHDMRYAIVAFDVLMSQLKVDQNVTQLQEYFKAATTPPREYAGHMNDPENPEAVEWFKAMQGVSES